MKYLFSIALLLIAVNNIKSQPYYFEDVQGLPPITDVYESAQGDIWLGTDSGLYVRRSGQNQFVLEAVDVSVTPEVTKVKEFSGNIWVATGGQGAYFLNGTSWFQLNTSLGLPSDYINDMTEAAGEIWLATDSAIARFNGNTVTTYQPFSNSAEIIGIASLGNIIWASNRSLSEPIMKFSSGSWTALPLPPSSVANVMSSMSISASGTLTGTSVFRVGIYSYFNGNWHVHSSYPYSLVNEFTGDSIYVITQNALHLVRDSTMNYLHALQIPPHYNLTVFHNSGNNNFWLAGSDNNQAILLKLSRDIHPTYAELDINSIKAGFSPSTFFRDENPVYSVDDGFGKFTSTGNPNRVMIFAAGIWTAGMVNGQLKGAAHTFDINGRDWYSGPVSSDYRNGYIERYNRVWKINRKQIEDHLILNGSAGYTMPEVIRNWPGNGNPSAGEALVLAPFMDLNSNAIYEPQLGEYPQIKGDQAVFFMFNDDRGAHYGTGSAPLHLEVHGMAYAYDTSDADLDSTIFISFKILNRSAGNINNFKAGLWTDVDLGYPVDDLVGCDSLLGLTYAYNADNDDNGPMGFQANPPAMGILFLSDTLDASINYANAATSAPAGTTDPEVWLHYVNYLSGLWKDGLPLLIENPDGILGTGNGDGYVPAGGAYSPSRFHFNDQVNWYQNPGSQNDSRNLSTAFLSDLPAGGSKCLEVAYTYSRDKVNGHLGSLARLKTRAAAIKQFYINKNQTCLTTYVGNQEHSMGDVTLGLFPIPAGDYLNIFLPGENEKIISSKILNIAGQVVAVTGPENKVDVRRLANGIYFITCKTTERTVVLRFVKE